MSAETALLPVIRGERRDVAAGILRTVLAGLAFVYAVGLKMFLLPYRLGIRRQTRLACPVISIGNLTVGGTGKTSMTAKVCGILNQSGLKVCVLNRGYKGASEHSALVVSTEERVVADAKSAGDEAILLAQTLNGIPVIVGKDRRITGRMAIEQFHPDVIVLDDGMQFYQLHRDLDIVLIDSLRPFDNGWTFPRGLLREPPSHLARAGCIVITNADKIELNELRDLSTKLQSLTPGTPILHAEYVANGLRALDRSGQRPAGWLNGRRVASFCALGNPENFEQQIIRAGANLVHSTRFPDHHNPTMGELNDAISAACAVEAEAIVVTEKDAVKLPPLGRPLPFYALTVTLNVNDQDALRSLVLKAAGK